MQSDKIYMLYKTDKQTKACLLPNNTCVKNTLCTHTHTEYLYLHVYITDVDR